MPGYGPEDERQRDGDRGDQDSDPYRTSEQQLLDIRLADVQRAERCGLGLAEEDEQRIKLVLVGDEEENGKRVGDEELRAIVSTSIITPKGWELTKKRLDLGCTSRKMSEKPTARPIQRMTRPAMRRTRAETGVRLPNAFARRKRGKASCSIAR